MLSLCMIVRDEEATLPDCLQSVQGLVDEILIVDTGSSDRTPQIAQGFGAVVKRLEHWDGDFAAARNLSIEMAKGDWILVLDADERLDPHTTEELGPLLMNDQAQAYALEIINLTGQGEGRQYAQIVRLFRNRPEFRYERAIHEQILPAILRQGYDAPPTGLRIIHHGYLDAALKTRDKYRRNLDLLIKETERHPEDPYNHFCLGQTYKLMGDYAAAQEHYATCLRLMQGQGTPYDAYLYFSYADLLLRSGAYQEGMALAREGLEKYPTYSDLTYVLGQIHLRLGNVREAKGNFKRCLELARFRHSGGTDPGTSSYKALGALAVCHEQLGEMDRALSQLNAAVTASPPGEVEALLNRGILYSKLGQFKEAREDLQAVLKWGNRAEAWQNLAIAAMKEGDYRAAKEAFGQVPSQETSVLLGEIALRERNPHLASQHFEAGGQVSLAEACRQYAGNLGTKEISQEGMSFIELLNGKQPERLDEEVLKVWELILEVGIRLEAFDTLEQFINQSRALWAKSPKLALMIASLLERKGFGDAACDVALDAQRLHPEESGLYRILGRICQQRGLPEDAAEMFRQADLLVNRA